MEQDLYMSIRQDCDIYRILISKEKDADTYIIFLRT